MPIPFDTNPLIRWLGLQVQYCKCFKNCAPSAGAVHSLSESCIKLITSKISEINVATSVAIIANTSSTKLNTNMVSPPLAGFE